MKSLHTTTDISQSNNGSATYRVGIVYDRQEDYRVDGGPADRFAEFEPESTIEAMEQAVLLSGHFPVRIGSPCRLLDGRPDVDLIWNIGEGYGSRNREAWTPVLCEMMNLPCLGSDAYTLTVTLDKVLTKQIAREQGIPVSDWQVVSWENHNKKPDISLPDPELPFPLFLKPRYEGTSKGIDTNSIVRTPEEFRRHCRLLLETYHQDVLVEPFLCGAELTCAVAFNPIRALPIMERGLHASGIGSHAVSGLSVSEDVQNNEIRISNAVTDELEHKLTNWSTRLCDTLHIRDFARFDYKLNSNGDPVFLEVNPLPTFAVDSTYAILAEIENRSYPDFLAEILIDAITSISSKCPKYPKIQTFVPSPAGPTGNGK